jgi:hypothetical protein
LSSPGVTPRGSRIRTGICFRCERAAGHCGAEGAPANGGQDTGKVDVTVKVDGNGSRTTNGTEGTDLRTDLLFGQNRNDALNGLDGNDLLCSLPLFTKCLEGRRSRKLVSSVLYIRSR